jgi:hypothetical protein
MISDFSRLRTRQTDEDVPGAKQKKMSGDATQRGLDYHVLGLVDTGSERRPKSMLAIAQEACTAASGQTCSHKNMRDCIATAIVPLGISPMEISGLPLFEQVKRIARECSIDLFEPQAEIQVLLIWFAFVLVCSLYCTSHRLRARLRKLRKKRHLSV